jgi:DNA (cytosine-5)-methyltransferase 1
LLARAVASQLLQAMEVAPRRPQEAIGLGDEDLLRMTMSEAARYYEVSGDVVGKRLRPAERPVDLQLEFALA